MKFSLLTPLQYELSIRNKGLHNLSKKKLSRNEVNVLSRGLKFIVPQPFDRTKPAHDLAIAWNALQLSLRSAPFTSSLPIRVHSKKHKQTSLAALAFRLNAEPEVVDHFVEDFISNTAPTMNTFFRTLNDNAFLRSLAQFSIPKCEIKALKNLENNKRIMVKPADKNLGLCIVDTQWYNNEMLSQLKDRDTYQLIPNEKRDAMLQKHTQRIRFALTRPRLKQLLDEDEAKFLQDAADNLQHAQAPHIYLLIKMHKTPIAGRPIIPSLSSITTDISKWLDWKLQPLAREHISTIAYSSQSIVQDLEQLTFPSDCILATADISSLFTKIPTEHGIAAIIWLLEKAKISEAIIDIITDFLRMVLENNFFYYKGTLYLQVNGTAMGTPVAPVYANIFVGWLEIALVIKLKEEKILLYYKRYIDDTLFVFSHQDSQTINRITLKFNQLNANIVFNFELSSTNVTFLDLHIFKGKRFAAQGIFDIRTHKKQMNLHLYVPFTSFQPIHQKLGLIKTELVRYIRNSSCREDYIQTKTEFFEYLKLRGYPNWFLSRASKLAWYKDRSRYLFPSAAPQQRDEQERIHPFKVPFNKITARVNFKRHLLKHYHLLKEQTGKRIVICFKNGTRLLSRLTRNQGPPQARGGKNLNKPNKSLSNPNNPAPSNPNNPNPRPNPNESVLGRSNNTAPRTTSANPNAPPPPANHGQQSIHKYFARDKSIKKGCTIS